MNYFQHLVYFKKFTHIILPICLSLLVGITVSFSSSLLQIEMVLVGLNTLILFMPFALSSKLRSDLLSPVVVVCILYFLYLVVSPAYDLLTKQTVFLGREFRELYSWGLLWNTIIIVSFWIGYLWHLGVYLGSSLPVPHSPTSWGRTYSWWLLLCAVSGLFVWSRLMGRPFQAFFLPGILTQTAEISNVDSGYNYLFFTIELFIPGILLGFRFNQPKKWLIVWIIIAILVYISLGFRYRVLVLGLSILVHYNIVRKQRLSLMYIGLAFIIAVTTTVWIGNNRDKLRSAAIGQQNSVTLTFSSGWDLVDNAFYQLKIFPPFLAVLDAVPRRVNYDYGLSMVYIFLRAIPREIWPDKPPPSFQKIITSSIDTHIGDEAGAAYPHFGEYYIAFGTPSLILGMIIFGVGIRTLTTWFDSNSLNPWVAVTYAVSTGLFIQIVSRGFTAQNINTWAYTVLPILLAGPIYRACLHLNRRG